MIKKILRAFLHRPKVKFRERERIYWRDSGRCRYCGVKVPFNYFDLDHVKPYSWGGINFNNLVTSCKGCNRNKSARHWKPRKVSRIRSLISHIIYFNLPKFTDFI